MDGPAMGPVLGGVAGSLWRVGVASFGVTSFDAMEDRDLVGRAGRGVTVSGSGAAGLFLGDGEGEGEGRGDVKGDEVGGGFLLALLRPYPAVVDCSPSFLCPVSSSSGPASTSLFPLLSSRIVVKVACSVPDPLLVNLEEPLLPEVVRRLRPEETREGEDTTAFLADRPAITSSLCSPLFPSAICSSSLSLSVSEVMIF